MNLAVGCELLGAITLGAALARRTWTTSPTPHPGPLAKGERERKPTLRHAAVPSGGGGAANRRMPKTYRTSHATPGAASTLNKPPSTIARLATVPSSDPRS